MLDATMYISEPGEFVMNEIDWTRITPFPSLRIFELENAGKKWTERALDYAESLGKSLPSVISQYPPKSRGKARNIHAAAPKNITPVDSCFFATQKDLTAERKFNKDDDYTDLSPDHAFLTAAWFRLVTTTPWLKRGSKKTGKVLEDVRHHIVIAAILPPYIYIASTHQPMHTFVSSFLKAGQSESICLPEPAIPVKDTVLEDAFVKDEAYRLWLSGLHRSVVTKADKKTFAGKDLRHAVDPYAEQSFAYSAIISRLNGFEKENKFPSIGYSRRSKIIWMAKSKGIMEYCRLISLFRDMLLQVDPSRKTMTPNSMAGLKEARLGLNYLSKPISASAIADARVPFEINLELDEPSHEGNSYHVDEEEWRTNGHLELAEKASDSQWPTFENTGDSMTLSVNAFINNTVICRFCLEVSRAVEEELTVNISRMEPEDIKASLRYYDMFERLIYKRGIERSFNVRFESGHVLNGNHLFKPEYQDVLYKEFTPVKLKGFSGRNFNPSKEKPDDWDKTGREKKMENVKAGDSLFARVACDVKGLFKPLSDEWYLLCHDQANEVADFIFIEPTERRVELVHVKGATSDSKHRRISIDAFQVVCQQAVKNLRHLEEKNLYWRFKEYIEGNKSPREAGVFLVSSPKMKGSPATGDMNGISIECSGFIEGLKRLRKGLPVIHKKVIVFQPHIRKRLWKKIVNEFLKCKKPGNSSKLRPAFMLSSILIETEIACRKLGVEFEVWSEDDKKVIRRQKSKIIGARRRHAEV